MQLCLPTLMRILLAVGCHWIFPTLLWWYSNVTMGSVILMNMPPSGICHTLIVQSSLALAITYNHLVLHNHPPFTTFLLTLSLKGHHWISSTAPLWPATMGLSLSWRPTWKQHTFSASHNLKSVRKSKTYSKEKVEVFLWRHTFAAAVQWKVLEWAHLSQTEITVRNNWPTNRASHEPFNRLPIIGCTLDCFHQW